MVIFRSTNAERRGSKRVPRTALLLAILVAGGGPLLRAGTVITLGNGSQLDGKLSVAGTTIHTDSPNSPADTDLSDVLESKFGDAPFALNTFFAGKDNQLPPNWTAQDIGEVSSSGSLTVQDGTFTLKGSSIDDIKVKGDSDHLYYAGVPWTEDGQFTARLVSLDTAANMSAGVIFRDSLDPAAAMCDACLDKQGQVRLRFRREAGRHPEGSESTGAQPLWLRFSRYGTTVVTSDSTDGNDWNVVDEAHFNSLTNPVAGLVAWTGHGDHAGTAIFDHVSITPLPSSAQILPAGVLLQGGSVLAGYFNHLSFDPAAADGNSEFVRGTKKIAISRTLIAGVFTLPTERSKLSELGANPTVLMKNGDMMDGTVIRISSEQVSVSSVLLGLTNYKPAEMRACFVRPLQIKSTPFEVRLRDGSILYATAVTGDADEVVITDASGLAIQAVQTEVAQIRAGPSVATDLAPLAWKATSADPVANPAPPSAPPLVQSWLGNDQEQILESGMGTNIEFPLPGRTRAFGVQVALSSDSPANATAVVHILADGHEVAKSPPFRTGDSPRFLELNLMNATHLSLQAESIYSGTKVLYLDPVALQN